MSDISFPIQYQSQLLLACGLNKDPNCKRKCPLYRWGHNEKLSPLELKTHFTTYKCDCVKIYPFDKICSEACTGKCMLSRWINNKPMTQKELGTNFTAFVCDCPAFKYEDWVVL